VLSIIYGTHDAICGNLLSYENVYWAYITSSQAISFNKRKLRPSATISGRGKSLSPAKPLGRRESMGMDGLPGYDMMAWVDILLYMPTDGVLTAVHD